MDYWIPVHRICICSIVNNSWKTKEMNVLLVVVYLIQNSAYLHKRFVRFSHLKSFISLGFSRNTNVYINSYHKYTLQYSRPCCIGHITSRLRLEFVHSTCRPTRCLFKKHSSIFRHNVLVWAIFHYNQEPTKGGGKVVIGTCF